MKAKNVSASMARAVGALSSFLLRAGLLFFAAALLAGCGAGTDEGAGRGAGAAKAEQAQQTLGVETASGAHKFTVELALTKPQQRKGLMFRRQMRPDHSMLFIYKPARPIGMWMKNTYIPLDMLFVQKDGVISQIERNTEPFSQRVISTNGPVYGVLEVVAGTADRLKIRVGDRLVHPLLQGE